MSQSVTIFHTVNIAPTFADFAKHAIAVCTTLKSYITHEDFLCPPVLHHAQGTPPGF